MREGADGAAVATRQLADAPYAVGRLLGLARRRAALIASASALATALAVVYVAAQVPVYRATVEILVDPQGLQVVGRDIVRPDTSASLDFANVDSQALVMVSTSVLRRVVEGLHLEDDAAFQVRAGRLARLFGTPPAPSASQRDDKALDVLRRDIVVHRVDTSLVFQVTVSNAGAERAAEIANALAAAYLKQVARERVDAVERSNASLIGQVSDLRAELDTAEAAVERFRSENDLIRSSDTGLVVTQQLKDLYTEIDAAAAEVARLAARKDQLDRAGPEALLTDTVPEALNSATVAALRGQYAQSARELASLGQTLLPQHPRIQEVRAELGETERLLKAELVRIRASVATAYAQAVANLAKLHARAEGVTRDKVASSAAEVKLRQLESEAEAIRAVFNASLGRARELEQQGKIATSNSRVLSDATPPLQSSKPPIAIVLAAAALFGACAGLGLAFLLDEVPRPGRRRDLTARDAGDLLGVSLAVALRSGATMRRAGMGEAAPAALQAVARELQQRFGASLPVVVAIVPVPGTARAGEIGDALGQALAEFGEKVLVCDARAGVDGMRVRHIAPRGRRAEAAGFVAAARGLGRPQRSATAAPAAPRAEFIIAEADAPGSPVGIADAIVLAVDLARTGSEALEEAARRFDPTGRRIAAVVALDTAADNWPRHVAKAAA